MANLFTQLFASITAPGQSNAAVALKMPLDQIQKKAKQLKDTPDLLELVTLVKSSIPPYLPPLHSKLLIDTCDKLSNAVANQDTSGAKESRTILGNLLGNADNLKNTQLIQLMQLLRDVLLETPIPAPQASNGLG